MITNLSIKSNKIKGLSDKSVKPLKPEVGKSSKEHVLKTHFIKIGGIEIF